MGRHFVLELSWIKLSTESLSQIVQRAILARLPTTTRRITLEGSHTQLLAVRSEKFVTCASSTILSTFDAVLTTLGSMKLDISPSIDDSSSKFYVQAVSMCANFLAVVEGGSGTAPLTGTKALAFQLEKYEKEVVAGKAVNISELESLRRFKWLFSNSELDRLILSVGRGVVGVGWGCGEDMSGRLGSRRD